MRSMSCVSDNCSDIGKHDFFKYSMLYLFVVRNNRDFTVGRNASLIQYVKYFVWQSTFGNSNGW